MILVIHLQVQPAAIFRLRLPATNEYKFSIMFKCFEKKHTEDVLIRFSCYISICIKQNNLHDLCYFHASLLIKLDSWHILTCIKSTICIGTLVLVNSFSFSVVCTYVHTEARPLHWVPLRKKFGYYGKHWCLTSMFKKFVCNQYLL